jgi:nitrite reductase/ring-hydroxylating ferredoxin subunit
MLHESAVEIERLAQVNGLVGRILNGEVIVLRGGLQQLGLFELLVESSLEGIRNSAGNETANQVRQSSFAKIHECVEPASIPAVTDAVYKVVTGIARTFLESFVPRVFPDGGTYYFERSPNVRFHIPYDRAAAQRREFDKFAKKVGEGKISAHGPHRDAWVDCPENAINVWIAVGPVRHGNGLTVFTRDYRTKFEFKNGYIASGTLHKPLSFDLQPGDVVLFHSNHLHGSELNRTDETRYVVSFRITFGKPHYPHGHYHHYLHAGLAGGPWRWLAEVPQNLQWSFFRYQLRRLRYKLTGRGRMSGRDESLEQATSSEMPSASKDDSIALASFPVGSIRAFSRKVCVARLGENEFAALSRHCPHSGGDLARGWLDEEKIVCPLHSMPFDPETGASPCNALPPLRRFACSVHDGRVYVDASELETSEKP